MQLLIEDLRQDLVFVKLLVRGPLLRLVEVVMVLLVEGEELILEMLDAVEVDILMVLLKLSKLEVVVVMDQQRLSLDFQKFQQFCPLLLYH